MAAATSGRSSAGGASADSYIGSLISLTSKSEIRYEGILFNISAEESSIGLRNVRSFGTEGRKKDGPQLPPSDKIYEYILFRGSDIKDLQVKASPPPVQTIPPINGDPAIIQSHYSRPSDPPTSLVAPPNGSLPDHVSQTSQMEPPRPTFQNSLHLYHPGGNMNSWAPPNTSGSGLAMPMYWSPQGFYGTQNVMPSQLPQQPLLRPPASGPSIIPSMQQMQFSSYNSSLPTATSIFPTSTLPDYHPSLFPSNTSSSNLTSTSLYASTLPLSVPPLQSGSLVSDTLIDSLPNKAPMSDIPTLNLGSSFPSLAQTSSSVADNAGSLLSDARKPSALSGPAALPEKNISQPGPSILVASGSSPIMETQMPSLITPGKLLHSAPAAVSGPQTLQTIQKDVDVVQVSAKPLVEPSVSVKPEAQPPILPLPTHSQVQKRDGGAYHMRNNYRGRGGRGPVFSRHVARFSEEFDFTAMNEKFKKDEVWGHLGKSNKPLSKDKEENGNDEEDFSPSEGDADLPKIDINPVYNKDDFFDSLSCNALHNNEPKHRRPRYSEQMKLDTETFGDFSRYRGGRGPSRGGGWFRGSYHGRGYGGGSGFFVGRGRGGSMPSRPS